MEFVTFVGSTSQVDAAVLAMGTALRNGMTKVRSSAPALHSGVAMFQHSRFSYSVRVVRHAPGTALRSDRWRQVRPSATAVG